jgi:HEAT repeat protein
LGRIGSPAVPALIAALKDERGDVRRVAAWELGRMGAPAVDAIPALLATLTDEDGEVRVAAAEALERVATPEALAAVARWRAEESKSEQALPPL